MQYRLHEISVGKGVLNVRAIDPDPEHAFNWTMIGQKPETGASERPLPSRTRGPGSPILADGPSA